ncbi:NAD(P)-dependent alcohol dehydrogenase [Heyndrickxia oleronia]|jgi:aryl-alcohol dehydrogenase|uniref:Aryl-alcohol dehydrogenase n=1 Tax=Heyndrickxia oleronia TaxID=38875 RepID=A0A8E2I7N6_9BACI|nr:NAD(P)-dependent alcohol dehydrogenase [Heyndrickxia oleronia]NYV67413.1 NAD(P)-dependent alcohol dehydrogenase [Bacillus sp. Gen3]MCI1591485.1 NAD(P)-dependent alcohol dehydrogenase [Heyndrickxia oleronia]MCI1614379.1 NAD(P)-dependent alcohol dehydrogenase [Heyndrickxia oleronia]MCI1745453.1 NAD(P)-dependent alcohol dehydrogenase [Heyndrickxia oleronia]MCI1762260.1 NAD(P)-dependent alcohol dehydrogenase [Heyndrickxia oleronia]
MKINAAVTHGQGQDFVLEEVELADPKANEVLVKIIATGVCHTDAVARDAAIAPLPAVLGHEGAGIVEKVGENVTDLEPGDHVVLSFAHCGHCHNCLTGHPTACETFNELNFGGINDDHTHRLSQNGKELSTFFGQSSFGTFAISHERNVVKVDKEVDLALLGPLGCGIQTGAGTVLNKLQPTFGTSIAIFGTGAVGLSAIMAAKIVGCKNIIAIDVHDNRLELAKELGATHTLNGTKVDVVNEIKAITNGGTEFSIDTTGVPPVVRQSLHALRPLGIAAIVGVTPEMSIDVHNDLMAEGKTMMGVIEGDAVAKIFIPQLVDYYKRGLFPFDKLVKFYDFDQINEAFAASKSGEVIKPILKIQ